MQVASDVLQVPHKRPAAVSIDRDVRFTDMYFKHAFYASG